MAEGKDRPSLADELARCRNELQHAGLLLAESELRFHSIVAMSLDGVLVIDTEGRVCFANPASEKLLGVPLDNLLGHPFGWPVVVGEATELEITRGGETTVLEMRVARTEWEEEWASLATLRDVTDRARLVLQQQEALQAMREVDEMRKQFVATVSHDVRGPLSVIQGWADLLRKEWDGFPDQRKIQIIGKIASRAKFIGGLVQGLLDLSRIEDGDLPYDVRPFDVRAVVKRVVEDLGELVANEVRVDMPSELPSVLGDEDRHWQVLTNLIANAAKFSPPDAPIDVEAAVDGGYVRVLVRDRGRGIDPEHAPKLFGKFSRLPESRDEKTFGTGLGLYICKTMVEGQGGRIWLDGRPGQGATFAYTLPVAE